MKPSNKNVSNTITIVIIAVLALIALGLKKCRENQNNYPDRTITVSEDDWRHHKVIFTKHARCRMECREISEDEVEFILENGIINDEKSKEENEEASGLCPTYALEGNTKDGQHVRIVVGACEKITKVITAIDLEEEHECNCR